MTDSRYAQKYNGGENTSAHRLIAEKVLGKKLPEGAEIHHIDNDGKNNNHNNLVICPSAAYHRLLHTRQAALDATGFPHWRKCHICSEYGDPEKMSLYPGANENCQSRAFHRECANKAAREYKRRMKGKK